MSELLSSHSGSHVMMMRGLDEVVCAKAADALYVRVMHSKIIAINVVFRFIVLDYIYDKRLPSE
jgi:hypothetical protein